MDTKCDVRGCKCEATMGCTLINTRTVNMCRRHYMIAIGEYRGPVPDEEFDLVNAAMSEDRYEPPYTIIPAVNSYEIWDASCLTVSEFPTLGEARKAMEKLVGA